MLSEQRKYKLISAAATTAIMAVIVVICLLFGYMPPDPPIPESGVEVNLGYSDMGLGDNDQIADGGSVAKSASSSAAVSEQVATQSTQESVSMPTADKANPTAKPDPTPTAQTKVQEAPKQPELNRNALFSGSRNKNASQNGGSEGNTSGAGNMGKANGNPNASGYVGSGGGGAAGKGTSFSLVGRTARALPEPTYSSNQQGKIVITVYVDRQGNVIMAENSRGSTITDQSLVNQAIAAARNAKFSASETAAEKQKGTITYVFSRSN
ncbi:MAG: TonB family protein [Bacteroidales bacterium]|nr:TonB family protein [Candidatus Colimorpha onthohippi]